MATRSIKVKLDLKGMGESERSDILLHLKNTHELYHEGVRYYQDWLLMMRQGDVHFSHENEKDFKSGGQYKTELWEAVKAARKRNTDFLKQKADFEEIEGRKEEILKLIQEYYTTLCPVDADDNAEETEEQATATLRKKKKKAPRQKGFLDPLTMNGSANQETQKKSVKSLIKMGVFPLFPRFLAYGVSDELAFIKIKFDSISTKGSWDYSMWFMAVAALRSWNTWDRNQKKKIQELDQKKRDREELLNSIDTTDFLLKKILLNYEKTRNKEISENTANPHDRFILTKRVIRCLDEVIEAWKRSGSDKRERIESLARIQTRKRGKFGDPDFFRWLAEEKNAPLWREGEKFIRAFVQWRLADRERKESKDHAVMSRADNIKHPIWYNLEGPSGTGNHPRYDIQSLSSNHWSISLPLLVVQDGSLKSNSFNFPVRPSGQMEEIKWNTDSNGKLSIQFCEKNTGFTCGAIPKGAKLQFSRKSLEKWKESLEKKEKGPNSGFPLPYFNISWELQIDEESKKRIQKHLQKGRKDPLTGIEPIYGWFFDGEKKNIDSFEKMAGIAPGTGKPDSLPSLLIGSEKLARGYTGLLNNDQNLRFMAIDMGVRTFASCSVFRIQNARPSGKDAERMHIPVRPMGALQDIRGEEVYAVHERSFQIALPGDAPPAVLEEARRELEESRKKVKYLVNARRALRRIGLIGSDRAKSREMAVHELRAEKVNEFIEIYINGKYGWPFPSLSKTTLENIKENEYRKPDDYWKNLIEQELVQKRVEPDLRDSFQKWRKESRNKGKEWARYQTEMREEALKQHSSGNTGIAIPPVLPFYGQSFWGIDELNESRKLMQSFFTRTEEGGRNSSNRFAKGSRFAVRLQEHIQNRKEDRLKKGANAVVMHALGYEWVQCDGQNRPLDDKREPVEMPADPNNRVPMMVLTTGRRPKFLRTGFGNPFITRGCWVALHPPARVVIFEDLSRYRTREERPRAENGQLMKWAHRAIPAQVHMQGEIFGLLVGEVGAAYSSRFHAKSGAPGIRCKVFDKWALIDIRKQLEEAIHAASENGVPEKSWREHANQWPLSALKEIRSFDLSRLETILEKLESRERDQKNKETDKNRKKFGVLLPATGGEYFVTLKNGAPSSKARAMFLNADLNAAQNLAVRFLSRYQNPEKINMHADAGESRFLFHTGSKRTLRQTGFVGGRLLKYWKTKDVEEEVQASNSEDFEKALASKGFSVQVVSIDEKDITGIVRGLKGQKKTETGEESEEEAQDEDVMELKGVYSLFRDRSGSVLAADRWYSGKWFWSSVKQKIGNNLITDPLFQTVSANDTMDNGS